MKTNVFARKISFGILIACSPYALAAQFSSTTTVDQVDLTGSFITTPVTGLSQFNPGLGTLTGITFTVANTYSVTGSVVDTYVINNGDAHAADVQLDFQISLSQDLGGGSGLFYASHVNTMQFSCNGDAESNSCLDSETANWSGVTYTEVNPTTSLLNNSSALNHFIGTGNVSTLSLGLFHFSEQLQIIYSGTENLGFDNAYGDFALNMGPATVTVDYMYETSEVPLPGAVWLFGSGLVGLAGVARRRRMA
jgi:hypothetical protein